MHGALSCLTDKDYTAGKLTDEDYTAGKPRAPPYSSQRVGVARAKSEDLFAVHGIVT